VFIITAAKLMTFAFCMFPIAFAALAVGIIFGCFLLGVAKNPIEKDTLFANSMVAFVIVESFVFTAIIICAVVSAIF
jgi:F0F1-type ATP synthase membrane subunit c/vacuolar-type H+-ATPase subunit K